MNDNNINTIDNIFDDCLEAVLSGRSTVDDCLKRHPEYSEELEGLLQTSIALAHSPELESSAAAKMRIRVALNDKMAEWTQAKPKPFWRFGWANAIATFVVGLSLTGGGLAYAASGSLPGETLYPLKLGLEQALVGFAPTDDAKVGLYTAYNDRRVDEIVYLASIGDSFGIVEATSRIQDNFTAAAAVKGIDQDAANNGMLTSQPPVMPPGVTDDPSRTESTTKTPEDSLLGGINSAESAQLDELTAAAVGNTPAVQQALEYAAAILRSGYQTLLSNMD